MTKKIQAGSFDARSEQIIREEALKIARATHSAGQTKEQTKLIARGIAKGIAEYKKQEKIKQRDRARQRKKHNPDATTLLAQNAAATPLSEPATPAVGKLPGLTAATIFLLAGLVHLLRLAIGAEITVGTFAVPIYWSGVAGVAALLLAVWIYRATQESARRLSENSDRSEGETD
jgi:hypothetical protein